MSGPGKGALSVGHNVLSLCVRIFEMRLRLALIELEEEKEHLIRLLIMAGMTLVFTAFGLMSLLCFLFWSVNPVDRPMVIGIATAILLILAIAGAIITVLKARRTTLLKATREQLALDRLYLERRK